MKLRTFHRYYFSINYDLGDLPLLAFLLNVFKKIAEKFNA